MCAAVDYISRLGVPQAAEVRALIDRATVSDGTAPVSEQALHSLTRESPARHLLWTEDDALVGYANLVPAHGEHPAMAEAVVDPPRRAAGIGGRIVTQVLQDGGRGARVWAHGNLPAARAVADRLGLSGVRELLQLRRRLDTPELPECAVPTDVGLRTYRGTADDAELLRVNGAAFSWHPEQGGWTEREIAERRAEPWFDPAGLFLATDPGTDRVLGFHWTKVHAAQGDDPAIGEVYVVAIDPAAQGRGLGRLVTLAGLHYLRDRGLGSVLLYTEGENTAALHTYGRLAFERFHVDVAYALTAGEDM